MPLPDTTIKTVTVSENLLTFLQQSAGKYDKTSEVSAILDCYSRNKNTETFPAMLAAKLALNSDKNEIFNKILSATCLVLLDHCLGTKFSCIPAYAKRWAIVFYRIDLFFEQKLIESDDPKIKILLDEVKQVEVELCKK